MTAQELADRREIEDVLLRYYRGVDRLDLPLIEACFHPDARADFSGFGFAGDRQEFLDFLAAPQTLPAFERTMHFAGNVLIDLDGDVAFSETYCIAHHRGTPAHAWGTSFALNWLRYCDRFERRDGRWAIADRVCVVEWGAKMGIDEWMEFPPEALGRRDRTDPSYHD